MSEHGEDTCFFCENNICCGCCPTDERNVSCAKCSTQTPVQDFNLFEKGQHIAFDYSLSKFRSRCTQYQHHAIVVEVTEASNNTAKLKLVELTRQSCQMKIEETTETYHKEDQSLYLVKYKHCANKPDDIVKNADTVLQAFTGHPCYNIYCNNCEHIVTDMVVGTKESLQVQNCCGTMWGCLHACFFIAKVLLRVSANYADEIVTSQINSTTDASPAPCPKLKARCTKFATKELCKEGDALCLHAPLITLLVIVGLYFMLCITWTIKHTRYHRRRYMCCECLKEKLLDLWLTFFVFCITSTITYVLQHFVLILIKNEIVRTVVVVIIVALSIVLQWLVPNIRKACCRCKCREQRQTPQFSSIELGNPS